MIVLCACIPELPMVDDPCAVWAEPGLYHVVVEVEGEPKRRPLVYVPGSAGPRDIVVGLHGGGGAGREFASTTRFAELAEREGFVLVVPDGLGFFRNSWNAGGGCCGESGGREIDDVAFLDATSALLHERVCGGKVLAAGFSAGSMMAHRWGCQGREVDAVLASSGPLMVSPDSCRTPPLPVRHYHGEADQRVPYDGGYGDQAQNDFRSADATMEHWRVRNRCSTDSPRRDVDGDTTCLSWQCEVATTLCSIDGYGHAWPGGENQGASSDATFDGWAWFQDQFEQSVQP
ncbi:MAG: polyhydroxybutyrate depolymerase [Myxococcota bacterium]